MISENTCESRWRSGIEALLSPRSVAIVGASTDPTRIGGRPMDYYNRAGFAGALYPVNPARKEVQGHEAFPDIASLPGPVDFALLAIPAPGIADAIDACAEKGVKAALIFSAGFAEVGAEGAALQANIVARARRAGIRILGPNCLGMFNGEIGHCPTFSSALQEGPPEKGRIAMVTQSGAYGTHLLNMARARRMKVGTWISTGNEADITLAECLEYLVDSDSVDTIACYMEGMNDRDRFFHALEKARANRKLVTIIKVGTSAAGAEAAQSHTASLAGSDESFEAVLRHFGIPRARTTEEMLDIIYAASLSPLPKGRKLGILTVSGGAGVLMADAAEAAGLTTPPLPEDAQQRLKTRNPLSSPRNPIDITAHALNDFALVSENLASMLVDGGYDMLISFFTSWTASPMLGPKVQKSILDGLAGQPKKPVVVVCQGSDAVMASYEAHDLMVFEDPSRAIRALGHLADFAEAASAGRADPADLPVLPANVTLPAEQVGEQRAKQILAAAGIGMLPEEITATPNAAAEAATRIGFPVALKIVSPDIQHKTEVGGVALGLADADAVRTEAANMLTRVRNTMPNARIDGLLVTAMASEGIELVVGVRNDPVMGPMVMVGFGGIFVEIFKDVVLDIAPVTPTEARRMVERLKGAPLLHGARGWRVVDIDAVANAVSRLSVLAARQPGAFDSIEINLLLARAHDAVALDALIVPARKPGVTQETAA